MTLVIQDCFCFSTEPDLIQVIRIIVGCASKFCYTPLQYLASDPCQQIKKTFTFTRCLTVKTSVNHQSRLTCAGRAVNSSSRSLLMSSTSTGPTLSGFPAKQDSIIFATVQKNTKKITTLSNFSPPSCQWTVGQSQLTFSNKCS